MNCKNCGCEIEGNQKFCKKCGAEIIEKDNLEQDFKLSKKALVVIFASIIGLSTLAIGTTYLITHNKNLQNSVLQNLNNDNLYKVWANDKILFIDESGNEIIKLKADENKVLGEFREGCLFIGKQIKEVSRDGKFEYRILELSIMDKNGNIVKTFDKKAIAVVDDGETSASYLPEFYNGYAVIHFVDDSDLNKKQLEYENLHITDVYVDKNGREVKNIPDDVKKMLADGNITATRFETNELEWKEMPCSDTPSETCVGYIDKDKNIKIKPIFDYNHLCCGDWFGRNPKFINNYALVFIKATNEPKVGGYTVLTGGYRFINSSGEYINDEVYDYAQPFYGNLAYVTTKNKYGFINKQGQWVWSAVKPETQESYVSENDEAQNELVQDKYDNINFSREQMQKGYEFADKLKQIVKNKDINLFAEYIDYPININFNQQTIKINNKNEFLKFDNDKIFTDNFIKNVYNEDLFVNYRGFMLGNGEIWFYPQENTEPLIISINIIHNDI